MTEPWRASLRQLLDPQDLLEEPGDCWPYGYDHSRMHHPPDAVVFARNEGQIRELVCLCRAHRIALTTRGLGTNTIGASVPVRGGIVLSTERMNRLLEIDPQEQIARVEPGLINQDLQDALAPHGLFWAPDPSSAAFCTVGGNLACNAAGPRAVRYGTCRENTLQARAVAGTGEVLVAGSRTRKGVVGYDLLRLLIGSEGTLAIFTEATLLLRPRPRATATVQAYFDNAQDAFGAVCAALALPDGPAAVEFLDAACLDLIRGSDDLDVPDAARALLMLEIDSDPEVLPARIAEIEGASVPGRLRFHAAQEDSERTQLWKARKTLAPALRRIAPEKVNEDIVVPVGRLAELLRRIDALRERYPFPIVCFGHAGSGNLHVNLLPDGGEEQRALAGSALSMLFDEVLQLGGTLSGEHGVGMAKRPYIARELDPAALRMMHAVRSCFDPDGILNPDKNLPDDDSPVERSGD